MGFLNEKLATSDKGANFLPGNHIATIDRVFVYNPVEGQACPRLYIIELTVDESDNPDIAIGGKYAVKKEYNTKYGNEMVLQLLSAAEGKPANDPRYRGEVTIETEVKVKGQFIKKEKQVPALNLRLSELFDTEDELEEAGLERNDLAGKQVRIKSTEGVSRAGKAFVNSEFFALPKGKKAETDEDLFPAG